MMTAKASIIGLGAAVLALLATAGELPEERVSVHLQNASIREAVGSINQLVPHLRFNLEFDTRFETTFSIEATDLPLRSFLDQLGRAFRCDWAYEAENHTINIYPRDTGYLEYYPFTKQLDALELGTKSKNELFFAVLGSDLLKDRPFPIFYTDSFSRIGPVEWGRKKLEGMTLRTALNWLCANDGRNQYWLCIRGENGWATFEYRSKAPLPRPNN